jgi:hypothetical protein
MQVIRRVSNWHTIADYVRSLEKIAKPETAKCALGRRNFWLQAEQNYRTKKYTEAVSDKRLWQLCKRLDPRADLAQVYYATGGIGINWHRDAAYCDRHGIILNLGTVRLETCLGDDSIVGLDLTGGEIIQFDTKLPHRSIPIDPQRIGIGIWQAKIPLSNPTNWQSGRIPEYLLPL